MSGDLWIEIYEHLKEELGREPTYEEVRQAYADRVGAIVDVFEPDEDDEKKDA